jgi:hypothetical protein
MQSPEIPVELPSGRIPARGLPVLCEASSPAPSGPSRAWSGALEPWSLPVPAQQGSQAKLREAIARGPRTGGPACSVPAAPPSGTPVQTWSALTTQAPVYRLSGNRSSWELSYPIWRRSRRRPRQLPNAVWCSCRYLPVTGPCRVAMRDQDSRFTQRSHRSWSGGS